MRNKKNDPIKNDRPKTLRSINLERSKEQRRPALFVNFDFELKATTYTLLAETLCRKLEKQGGMLAFVSVLGDLYSACYLYSAC